MLGGIDEWVRDLCAPDRRAEEGGWWPSEQIMLYSAFPGYGRLYTRYGVPMQQVAWQPYAVEPSRFRMERPATEGTTIISAGHHRRDLDTLFPARRRAGYRHTSDRAVRACGGDVPPQRFRGTVLPAVFWVVGNSRLMVVPLIDDPDNAAGITALVTAIMWAGPSSLRRRPGARLRHRRRERLPVPAGDRGDGGSPLMADRAGAARGARGRRAQPMATTRRGRALVYGSRTFDESHWVWTVAHPRT
jgi:hypothetical protein